MESNFILYYKYIIIFYADDTNLFCQCKNMK